jgi:hypothetical protein
MNRFSPSGAGVPTTTTTSIGFTHEQIQQHMRMLSGSASQPSSTAPTPQSSSSSPQQLQQRRSQQQQPMLNGIDSATTRDVPAPVPPIAHQAVAQPAPPTPVAAPVTPSAPSSSAYNNGKNIIDVSIVRTLFELCKFLIQ